MTVGVTRYPMETRQVWRVKAGQGQERPGMVRYGRHGGLGAARLGEVRSGLASHGSVIAGHGAAGGAGNGTAGLGPATFGWVQ